MARSGRRMGWLAFLMLLPCLVLVSSVRADKLPEVSSTLLKMHRIYTSHPPHDSSLYDTLRVSPNATSAEIQKSYRKLCRLWHPDKIRHRQRQLNNNKSVVEVEQEMGRIRQAYEILKDDATRLPYHKYGLLDLQTAVLILTGFQNTQQFPTKQQIELLQLMGYYHGKPLESPQPSMLSAASPQESRPLPPEQQQEHRVWCLAATILEKIRPLVEGNISEQTLADIVADECDRLKKLPLGAQIIRCVGRAYRHSGRRFLRQCGSKKKTWAAEPMRDKWHDAKHFWTAAMASGKVVLKDRLHQKKDNGKQQSKHNKKPRSIAYHWERDMGVRADEDFSPIDDDSEDTVLTNKQMKREQAQRAKKLMIELLQVEALWKVHKIGLYRSVRDASDLILSGQYFFFPSHQSTNPTIVPPDWHRQGDGWVSSRNAATNQQGEAIDTTTGKLRAAAALVLVGEVMVQCSKEGTSWME